MLLCGISDVPRGAILGSVVADPRKPDHDLLRPGVALDAELISGLRARGVTQVWIEDDLSKDLDAAVAPALAAARMDVYTSLRDSLASCARGTVSSASIQEYRRAVLGMVLEAVASGPYAAMTDALFGVPGLAAHGANVAYLSMLCGLHLQAYVAAEQPRLGPEDARELSPLGLAGMLHDVGKTALKPAVAGFHEVYAAEHGGGVERPERYTEHPILGRAMLDDGRIPARVLYTIMHHHQRFDGGGWPSVNSSSPERPRGPLAGRRIHIFARIVSAANVLDALMRDPDGVPRPPVSALHEFASGRFDGWFDPIVRRAMILRVPPFGIGTEVRLCDGRRAVVIGLSAARPCKPLVRAQTRGVRGGPGTTEDLSLETPGAPSITHALGVDVRRYAYELPREEAARADRADAAPGGASDDGPGVEG